VFAVLRIRAVSSFVVADDIATPLTGSAESSSASAILATNARARKSIVGNRVEQTGDQVILLNYRRAAPRSGGRATNLPRPFPKTDLASKTLVPIGTKRQNEVA
jgi:hypothetical protein